MKKILTLLILFVTAFIYAQNTGISYQAVIYGPNGQQIPGANNQQYILANKTICLQFSIIDHQGQTEYKETIVTTTDKFGMVNLLIGAGTQTDGYANGFNEILWDINTKSLKVELDPTQACRDFSEISNNPFTYVPFAFHSANPGNPGEQGPIGLTGPEGPQGEQGSIGLTGPEGPQGEQGPIGLTGPEGPQGEQGPIGLTGPEGPQGEQGPIGLTGPEGPQGEQGSIGLTGPEGPQGEQGPIGLTGPEGPQGEQGPIGLTGPEGPQGEQGLIGLTGPEGPQGEQGPIGLTGPEGPQGEQGPIGLTGPEGPQGEQGPIGLTGPEGPQGEQGPIGLTGPEGPQGEQGPIGLTGPEGPQGEQGPIGLTGPEGPQGEQGPIGLTGPEGPQGEQGPIGLTGPEGPQGEQGPIGLTGPEGLQGEQGEQGPIGLTGPEGPQGEQGPIGLTGPEGPQGEQGPIGLTGPEGPQGEQGPIGLTGPEGPQGEQGSEGLLPDGSVAGNTVYWNGTAWIVNNSNIHNNGTEVGIGTTNPNASAKVEIASTTQGFLPPRLSNTQRDAITNPADGLIIFNNTTGCPNYYFAGTWYEWCGTEILPLGIITALNCGSATNNGTLTAGEAASGVNSVVPYTGGNAGTHNGQTITSTGVTGLTATLAAGTFANGAGTLTYTITGTPSAAGTASFALNIGGQSCTLTLTVAASQSQYPGDSVFCASGPTAIVEVINPSTGKTWMDRNLGATQVATSSNDAQAYGDLYQWGRRSDGHQCRNSATTTTLSSTDQPANGNFILALSSPRDWRIPQNTNLWQGVNGINNPCPSGYRLPTQPELDAERSSWGSNNAAGAFASPLKLPMAGNRDHSTGSLSNVGSYGNYWSSTVSSTDSRFLGFGSSNANMDADYRADGSSVRCLKDTTPPAGILGSLDCTSATNNGTLTAGEAASGVNSVVPYTGGNAGTHNGQTITSTGVTGLTATLAAGTFANGAGDLTYTITGTPSGAGTASFALNIGGQSCTLTLTVAASQPQYPGDSVFCASGSTAIVEVINPSTGKTWMDRNLGATQVATSNTDAQAYGDLYQWGRRSDGHQCRNSATTTTLSSTDQPANGNFILAPSSPRDWRSPQNNNLWQGVSGVNNPCPSGYRLPTEQEWQAELQSWSSNNAAGAFASPLKLPMAGRRDDSAGSLINVGTNGYCWSSTVSSTGARRLNFSSSAANVSTLNRARGYSVRCLKD